MAKRKPKQDGTPPENLEREANELLSGKAPVVVRHLGDPNKAITAQGDTVHRQDSIFVDEIGQMIECVPYDNHFIYKNPAVTERGDKGPVYLCTCGAVAGLIDDKEAPEEIQGKFVCQFDMQTGFNGEHQTSQVNLADFAKATENTQKLGGKGLVQ